MQITNCRVATVNVAASGNNTIVATTTPQNIGTTSQPAGCIKVWQVLLNGGGANVLTFQSGSSTPIGGVIDFTAAGSAATLQATGVPWFTTAAGQPLVLNTSTTAAVTGSVYFTLG